MLSVKTGLGLDLLRKELLAIAGWQSAGDGLFTARTRHVQALQAVQTHLGAAQTHLACQVPVLDLMAEELRLAQHALGEITGEFSSDDLLGVIFSSFCIGK
jgi:tRNA modification GTPase